ncbi:MAG: hypothetical protein Q7R32_08145 [Dehalococcoidia bacterium]|nr:hypothetical protein [Dehalococcoidia bacterium]
MAHLESGGVIFRGKPDRFTFMGCYEGGTPYTFGWGSAGGTLGEWALAIFRTPQEWTPLSTEGSFREMSTVELEALAEKEYQHRENLLWESGAHPEKPYPHGPGGYLERPFEGLV